MQQWQQLGRAVHHRRNRVAYGYDPYVIEVMSRVHPAVSHGITRNTQNVRPPLIRMETPGIGHRAKVLTGARCRTLLTCTGRAATRR